MEHSPVHPSLASGAGNRLTYTKRKVLGRGFAEDRMGAVLISVNALGSISQVHFPEGFNFFIFQALNASSHGTG